MIHIWRSRKTLLFANSLLTASKLQTFWFYHLNISFSQQVRTNTYHFSFSSELIKKFQQECVWHSRSHQRTNQRVLVLTYKFLALKTLFFPREKYFPTFLTFIYLYSMQLFSADHKYFQNFFKLIFVHKNFKKRAL